MVPSLSNRHTYMNNLNKEDRLLKGLWGVRLPGQKERLFISDGMTHYSPSVLGKGSSHFHLFSDDFRQDLTQIRIERKELQDRWYAFNPKHDIETVVIRKIMGIMKLLSDSDIL